MTGETRVRIAAVAMVAISLANGVILSQISAEEAKVISRIIRFVLTCAIAVFLFRGAGWARWLTGVLCSLGALGSLVAFAIVPAAGLGPSLLKEWMLLMTVAYGWISWTLFFDRQVSDHYRSRRQY